MTWTTDHSTRAVFQNNNNSKSQSLPLEEMNFFIVQRPMTDYPGHIKENKFLQDFESN